MKKLLSILFILLAAESIAAQEKEICLSADEAALYQLLNQYRIQKGLPPIPLSASLSHVAQEHVRDLHYNRPFSSKCNAHSWSGKGKWTRCCYTADHKKASCMWDKPRELTGYAADGFEIVHGYSSYPKYPGVDTEPETAIDGWKKSSGHNAVMINTGTWKNVEWKAVGIGMYRDFAAIWFGMETDSAAQPNNCAGN
jgi:hypothetical protein